MECKHDPMYCKHCKKVYCTICLKVWVEEANLSTFFYPNTYPSTTTNTPDGTQWDYTDGAIFSCHKE